MSRGPLDEFDDETSGDPDSTLGEESDEGFEEMHDWGESLFVPDDGIEDFPEGDEDEEGEDDDGGDDEDC